MHNIQPSIITPGIGIGSAATGEAADVSGLSTIHTPPVFSGTQTTNHPATYSLDMRAAVAISAYNVNIQHSTPALGRGIGAADLGEAADASRMSAIQASPFSSGTHMTTHSATASSDMSTTGVMGVTSDMRAQWRPLIAQRHYDDDNQPFPTGVRSSTNLHAGTVLQRSALTGGHPNASSAPSATNETMPDLVVA
jgi:hypothetical protein